MTTKQKTDQQAVLGHAYDDYKKGLNSYAFFKVHNSMVVEDLVQDTFVKTWSYLLKGGKIEAMKAFLYHVLNNLIIDEYRKRKMASLDSLIEEGFEPADTDTNRLFDALDGNAIILLIHRLPLMYQKIMRMRYVQDLSLTEMSVLTGKSKNTMSVQVHRGLAKLKVLYDPA